MGTSLELKDLHPKALSNHRCVNYFCIKPIGELLLDFIFSAGFVCLLSSPSEDVILWVYFSIMSIIMSYEEADIVETNRNVYSVKQSINL